MSNSVQVRRGTQKYTVRRDDIRVPKSMKSRSASESEPTSSLVAVSRVKQRKRLTINTSNLNLQQFEQDELQKEKDNALAAARRQDHSRAMSPTGETETVLSTLSSRRNKKQPEVLRSPRLTRSCTTHLVAIIHHI